MKPLFLKIYQNKQLIEVRRFHANQIVLGSGNVDIRLDGLLPSHAVLQRRNDDRYYIVIRAGVEPGIFIRGQQVLEYPLSSRDVFQLGHYHIEFSEDLSQTVSIASHLTAPHPPDLTPSESLEKTQITSVTQIIPPPGHTPQQPVTSQPLPPQASQSEIFKQQPLPPQAPTAPLSPPVQGVPQQAPLPPSQVPQSEVFVQQQPLPPQAGIPTFAPPSPTQRVPQQPPQPPSQVPQSEIFVQQSLPPQTGIPTAPISPPAQGVSQQAPLPPSQVPQDKSSASFIPSQPAGDLEKTQTMSVVSQPLSPQSEAVILQPQDTISHEHYQSQVSSFQKETQPHYTSSPQHLQPNIPTSTPSMALPNEMPEALLEKSNQSEDESIDFSLSQKKTSQVQTTKEQSFHQEGIGSHRKKRTFATSGNLKDINERIQPEEGSVVKVIVAWNEKILNTRYFDYSSTVRVGCHPKNDIILPVFGHSQDSYPLVKIDKLASLFVTYEMRGVLVKGSRHIPFDEIINSGAASRSDTGFTIDLQRGELARVDFDGGISVFIKYTVPSPKPLVGPFFDLTSAELNTLVMAVGTSIIMAIFFLIAHKPEVAKLEEEIERKAIFVYEPPKSPPIDPIPVKAPPVKLKPKRVKLNLGKKTQAPRMVKRQVVKRRRKAAPVKRRNVVQNRAAEGKAGGEIRQKTKSNRKVVTSANQSNKVRVSRPPTKVARKGTPGGKTPGRKQRDVSKSGLLGVFGRGGQQDSLRTAFDGAGVVENLAERARGSGGSAAGRSGDFSRGGLAAVGKGGRGESTYGIAGVKTKGRGGGGGIKGYGRGSLGGKVSVRVDVSGGAGESFTGVIDKEAIRRVVRRNVKQLQTCYERLAQRDPNASGRVELNWTINPNGRVGTVKVTRSQIKDKKALDCMRLRLASWRFPDPPPGVIGDINYPFVFVTSRQ